MDPDEIEVAPDAATEIQAPEAATEQAPEVVEPEQDAQPDAEKGDKAIQRMERRIQRLTAAKYQTQAEAQQAKAELETLRQRLAQYEQPEQPQQSGPDPLTLAKEIAKIEKVADKANTVAKDGMARFDNFKAALQVVSREAGQLFDQIGRPTALGEAILDADDPAAVLHYIGSDPDLASELADLTPIQQARRIAKLEAQMSKPKEPTKSNAPKPISPVKSNKADTGGLSDDLPMDEWSRRFYEQRSKRY